MLDRDEIISLLQSRMEAARERHQKAKEAFWEVAGRGKETLRTPIVLPHPDGNLLMRQAFQNEFQARREHLEAIIRFNRYLLDGELPPELEKELDRKPRARHGGVS